MRSATSGFEDDFIGWTLLSAALSLPRLISSLIIVHPEHAKIKPSCATELSASQIIEENVYVIQWFHVSIRLALWNQFRFGALYVRQINAEFVSL